MYVMIGGYTGYVWKGLGWRGFAGKAAIPLVGLVAAQKGLMIGVNWMREGLYSGKRKRMVSDYSSKYGKEYLIKVLNP